MELLLAIVGDLFVSLFFQRTGRRSDRVRVGRGRARCGLRAKSGRVLDIGTEWSTGVCEIDKGHLRFVPSVGIVGDRQIDVLSVEPVARPAGYPVVMADTVTYYELSTAAGDLYWAVPEHIAASAVAQLVGDAPPKLAGDH